MKLRDLDLPRLNSATKYPSIKTYHPIGEKGRLTEGPPDGLEALGEGALIGITEKIDGTNARVIVGDEGEVILGSRENLLHYHGDLLFDPAMGIVTGLQKILGPEHLGPVFYPGTTRVLYGEFYGHKVGAASKHYTATDAVGFRLFDVAVFVNVALHFILEKPIEEISAWREAGGQAFVLPGGYGPTTVPYLGATTAKEMPRTLADTRAWLERFRVSKAGLDVADGRAEGVVVRDANGRWVRKIRFQDYDHTLQGSR